MEIEARIARLEAQVAELTAKLYQDNAAEEFLIQGLKRINERELT